MATATKKKATKKKEKDLVEKSEVMPEITLDQINVEQVFSRGAIVIVNFGTPGFDRRISKDKVTMTDANVDKTMVSATKKLIECAEFKEIGTVNGKIKGFLQRHAIPTSVGAIESLYMIPIERFKNVIEELYKWRDGERKKAVDIFIDVAYDKAKKEAKVKLGPLFDDDDYPTKEDLRSGFYMNVRPLDFSVPGRIKGIDAQLFEAAKLELDRDFQEAAMGMRMLLRETMRQLVGHLAERLSGETTDGKPKVFRETAVTHVTEFLEHFAPRNLTDDAKLAELVDQTKKLLSGVDIEALRKPDEYRQGMAKDLNKITTALDALLTAKPSRVIKLRGKKE